MKDLALYLGITPETLSRKFALLEKQGQLKRQLRRMNYSKISLINGNYCLVDNIHVISLC